MQGKITRKKIREKKKVKKKSHAERKSNCDFYLTYKTCQRLKRAEKLSFIYSKYSCGLTPSPAILLLINKDI